ncbi:histidine phosphatase family protein [Nostoc sp. CHAB 5834]|nr:histidine phosphatase family protein [Nostoc sp. CHAB 5834]
MKNIYLVRHGESLANVSKMVHSQTPDHAIPLSARGTAQAQGAGKVLGELLRAGDGSPVRLWTSPYRRTRQTATELKAGMGDIGRPFDQREHINLCEQQFGLFDGYEDEELAEAFPVEHKHYALAVSHEGKFWPRMPMGESRFDVAVRVHQAFGTFHRDASRHGIENIIVVCHGVTMRAFIMQWLHLPYEWFEQQKNPGNCDIFHIACDEAGEGRFVYQDGKLITA